MAPTPPPYMGPSIATQIILNSRFVDEFNVIHIDTADRRPLSNLGRIDATNIYLTIKQYLLLLYKLFFVKADIVYIPITQTTTGFLRDIPFVALSKLFRKKVILHLRGGYFREFYNKANRIMKYVIQKTLQRIDRMIVLGYSLKRLFDGLIPEAKLSVVPNGIDMAFDNISQEESDKHRFTVLFLSNLVQTKGFWDVLHSIQNVAKHHSDVKYIFAGAWLNDNDKADCEKHIKEKDIGDYTEFTGVVEGKGKLNVLHSADVFVFPTYYPMEGHPWVIVEAMAAGLPVIATDQGAITESVVDGVNGYIVDKKSPQKIAEKVKLLIQNAELRIQMGKESKRLHDKNFTEKKMVERLINAIHEAVTS